MIIPKTSGYQIYFATKYLNTAIISISIAEQMPRRLILTEQKDLPNDELEAKVEVVNKVFQNYYKDVHHSLLKASDFYVPWFIKRKERIAEFDAQYIPLSVAMLVEGLRSTTTKRDGKPDTMLMSRMRNKLLPEQYKKDFEDYCDLIEREQAKGHEDIRPLVKELTTLLMYKLFGPDASIPNEDIINSSRHQMAVDFQIGRFLFFLTKGSEKGFDYLKKKQQETAEKN